MTVFLILQATMVFGNLSSPFLIVILLGFFGSSSILVYAGYAQIFPERLSGRVSTILNLLVFLSAFILQCGVGAIIEMWPSVGEGYAPESYQVAIGILVLIQILGLAWYFFSKSKYYDGTNY